MLYTSTVSGRQQGQESLSGQRMMQECQPRNQEAGINTFLGELFILIAIINDLA